MKGLPLSRPSSITEMIPGSIVTVVPKRRRGPLIRRALLATVVVAGLVKLHPAGVTGLARIGLNNLERLSCEERGLLTRASNTSEEASRVTIVVRASTLSGETPNQDNTILAAPLHQFLTTGHRTLFPSPELSEGSVPATDLPESPFPSCIQPVSHTIKMLPPPPNTIEDVELFFSACTSPNRAVAFAPIWTHFLGARPGSTRARPGCIVTDAQGQGDVEGWNLANAAFSESGVSCTMQESSRAGERYEMRVLGLLADAWAESERRRWEEEGPVVQWFVFNDDDTFWIDVDDLKHTLLRYDSSEDHFLGGFSEAVDNLRDNGRIAFGGAGMIISRSLVRKMQGLVGTCARKFTHVTGGDGILTNCAALARGVEFQDVVTEIPGFSQMDLKGDASGFLTSGEKLLSIHHWVGWLDLIPKVENLDAIALFAAGADAIGGRNMFRRWVFDGGRTVWTAGFSVMIHREALTANDLGRVEHSWSGYHPRKPSRQGRVEGEDKFTFFIKSVEHLSPTLTLFHHECDHPLVENDLRRIDILWDSAGERSWWERLGGNVKGSEKHRRPLRVASH